MAEREFNEIFSERLRYYLSKYEMTQLELSKRLGVGTTSVYNWTNGIKTPRMDKVDAMCKIFNCNRSDLMEEHKPEIQSEPDYTNTATPEEFEYLVKKYRLLDPTGKEHVDTVLEWEVVHQKAISEKDARITEMEMRPVALTGFNSLLSEVGAAVRIIQYYRCPASAGTGQVVFDDAPVDRIEIPDIQKYKRVSYAVSVNGDSMEPLYDDGDILLIEPTCELSIGEIGIFIVGSEAFVKELGDGELISLNADYNNIPLTEDSKCMGRVVGKFDK